MLVGGVCTGSEYGLLKVGAGGHGTLTGKLYLQDSRLSVHAGSRMACADGCLLLRTPLLGPHVLLKIDTTTLQVQSPALPSFAPSPSCILPCSRVGLAHAGAVALAGCDWL